ncbi:MAG TPA: hypothetical protein PLC76_13670 [Saprospiraceae bacterium]|jgi:hypothetical protein|nr:MAG: hypothetical protein UZ08_BCD001000827 [Candidatus Parvibacillus calidus]MBX2936335.1 hypothetical protein [Saprospiraceae bacterium]MCB0592211.1 hypothetical protein [Saprospiraceae bacterium]MCC7148382.1 hypothetical protein [Saprospiraceae bacterium]MCO5283170.1 hypothetical protein [Saprospiraceae bacterium]
MYRIDNHILTLYSIIFALALGNIATAQVVKTNSQGEKIVVFDDGSWRYFDSSDSLLLKNQELTNKDKESGTKPLNESSKAYPEKAARKRTDSSPTAITDPEGNLPDYNCVFTFSGTDEYSKKKRVDLKKEILWEYTDTEIASLLKGRSYVTCEAGLIEFVGKIRVLSIKITIASRMARAEYGYINSNSLMSIKLLNGEVVNLFAEGGDIGQIDNEKNQTTYKASFGISAESQKMLSTSLIDKIKLIWSTGYEEYPVTNIDFFVNQLNCLNNQ